MNDSLNNTIVSGRCGKKLKWFSIGKEDNYTLVIKGTGSMEDYKWIDFDVVKCINRYSDFRVIARVALCKKPQLPEALGIVKNKTCKLLKNKLLKNK
ncbi:MAG: hypothetical protein LBR10_05880 [Prevotellaceae bacterium]|jgi:hypothetical protein|nr:hypothetical protein [Prevotellaceae bacterium]